MPRYGDNDSIRVARIDGDLRNLLPIAQAKMRPRLSRVRRFVDAVADRKVGTLQAFAAADVNDIRIRRRHRDTTD